MAYVDHHTVAIISCNTAALELISMLPQTDTVNELREMLENQFDILDCVINHRHFGSDDLDFVIHTANAILQQVKECEND